MEVMNMIDFKLMKALRIEAGLTQMDMAERTGISQTHYAFIERGLRIPTIPYLEAIAAVFGATAKDFIVEEANPQIPRKVARKRVPRGSGVSREAVRL